MRSQGSIGCVTVFLALLVLGFDIFTFVPTLSRYWFFGWHEGFETPCEVIGRKTESAGKAGTYGWITFRYNVDGTSFTCRDTVSNVFYREHPEGSEAVCYVSPVAHRRALLWDHFHRVARDAFYCSLFTVAINVAMILAIGIVITKPFNGNVTGPA